MKVLILILIFLSSLYSKNVLVLNSYSSTFEWTKYQSRAIISALKIRDDINIYVEFMDTKKFKPTNQTMKNKLNYYSEKYKFISFDVVVVTDDNAINFMIENKDKQLFKNSKIFFSGVNNLTLRDTLNKDRFAGVFEVKNPLSNLAIAKQLNKNLKTVYLIGDNTVTSKSIINLYTTQYKNINDINFEILNYTNIDNIIEKLKKYEKNSVMMIVVPAGFTKNDKHIGINSALNYISNNYKNPIIVHDNIYTNIGNPNIIGGDCVDGKSFGEMVALDILKYFDGTAMKDIRFKSKEGNSVYLNEKVLNSYGLDIEDIATKNPIIVNKNYNTPRKTNNFF
ncbi:MAG: hypothetical protein U9R37_03140 [Campylobacterota bacterium]|nr:hypothetical protein [Campylobacterota bacterium]